MKRGSFARLIRLLLVVAALALTIGTAAAETKKATRPANCGSVTVTDAAGRKHTIMKMHCITQAERKAAAKRARALAARASAERQKGLHANQGVTR